MKLTKRKSLICVLIACLLCTLFSSCSQGMTGKYIPDDPYSSDIIIDSIEFNGNTAHIEAGGQSINLEYKIDEEAFELVNANNYLVNGQALPDVYIYKRISHSSFSLNNVVYVIEDSYKNQDRDFGSFDEEVPMEEQIEEYIDGKRFQSFIDSYSINVESKKNVKVDAYASGETLVIELKYKKEVNDKNKKKVTKTYKKYLRSLSKNKKKRRQFVKLRKDSKIKGMKLKIIVVDSKGNFIAQRNF